MRAGLLRHRVQIQQNSPSRDAFGAEVDSWSELDTVWGAIDPIQGNERFSRGGSQELAEATNVIVIRHRTDVTHKMRVVWSEESRTFDILRVENVNTRDRETRLYVKELPSG